MQRKCLTPRESFPCETNHFCSFTDIPPAPINQPQAAISSPNVDWEMFDMFSEGTTMGQVDPLNNFASPPEAHNQAASLAAPTPAQQMHLLSRTPSTNQSTSSLGQSRAGGTLELPQSFLQRDNERLRAGNRALHNQVEILRRKHGRVHRGLDELSNMLQELLYLPAPPASENERVVNVDQLFGILDQVVAIQEALNSYLEG